jgi:multicomponent Na+:H+ antiporter subunit C
MSCPDAASRKLVIGLVLLFRPCRQPAHHGGRRLARGRPPIVADTASALAAPYADPLPQALVLTAIVIGFGVAGFALVLLKRAYQVVGTDDLDAMRSTDQ